MLLDFIALGVLLASLIGIGIILGRKLPLMAAIDTNATRQVLEERLEERKSSLIEQRLRRKFQTGWSKLAAVSQPVLQKTATVAKQAQQKLVDLEHEYKVRSLPVFLNRRQRQRVNEDIQGLLDQAKLLYGDEEYRAAEEKAMQAIRLDPKNIPAFEFLGELYMTNKEFSHAKEVYRYLLKLTGDSDVAHEHLAEADIADGDLNEAEQEFQKAIALNANVMRYHLELAQVERQLEHWPEAFASIQEAAHLEPNNPKVLDELIEISLGHGKKDFAADAIAKVKEQNPDNAKISEWERRLAELMPA